MRTGICQYRYNPSEQYQRTQPGGGPETSCGARTYPAVDEPELIAVARPGGRIEFVPSGALLPREQPDPYCPRHGGMPEPPPPPATMQELEAAYQAYVTVAGRFTQAVPVAVPEPTQIIQELEMSPESKAALGLTEETEAEPANAKK